MGTIGVGLILIAILLGVLALIVREERACRRRQTAYRSALRRRDWDEVHRMMGIAPPIAPSYTIEDGGRDGHD